MAILSNKKIRSGPSSGHDFDRIKEKSWGGMHSKINMMRSVYSSDYIYKYSVDEDDDLINDGEVGINKMRHRMHDSDWCNGEKNERQEINRFFNTFSSYDDGDFASLGDIFNDDGSINFDELQDFVEGE